MDVGKAQSGSASVLIAAGGTGGHIYPALAIADALRELSPETRVDFVGTRHGLENKIIPAKGYQVHHLPIGRLNKNVSLAERLRTMVLLPWALVKSALLLLQMKPKIVLGVGGHASGPLLLAASLLGYRTAIWEPNAMPGMANRILSRFVDDCWMVFDEAREHLHGRSLHQAGMPVRREIEDLFDKANEKGGGVARSLSSSVRRDFHILVFGGSLGARGLNDAVVAMVKDLAKEESSAGTGSIRIVHQTGTADFDRVRAAYGDWLDKGRTAPVEVDLREYLNDMENQYAKADLVISRSGTGTLSELAACGKPAVLVPFPFAADDHQKKNAESLVKRGAAIMIEQRDLTSERLRSVVEDLRRDPVRLGEMSKRIRAFHHPRAAKEMAGEFLTRIS